jgi:hypothetical protein
MPRIAPASGMGLFLNSEWRLTQQVELSNMLGRLMVPALTPAASVAGWASPRGISMQHNISLSKDQIEAILRDRITLVAQIKEGHEVIERSMRLLKRIDETLATADERP